MAVKKEDFLTLVITLFLVFLNSPSLAVDQCGPGNHWIDNCGADTDDILKSEATLSIDAGCDGSSDSSLTLSGPVKIRRGDPKDALVGHPIFGDIGDIGNVDGHKEVIETEIVSMVLKGSEYTLRAGDGTGNLSKDGDFYSPGRILKTSSTQAESLFHLFFEIETPEGEILHNKDAHIMQATITGVPPIGKMHFSKAGTNLFNSNDIATDICIVAGAGHVLKVIKDPAPDPEPKPTPTFSEWGLIIFTLLLLTVATRFIVRHQVTLNTTGTLSPNNIPLLTPIVFRKALIITSLLFLIGLLLALGLSYSPSSVDMVGSLISVFILAYLLHLLMLLKR